MRIHEIKTILTCPDRNYLIVKIETDQGIVGYGDATLNGRELAVQAIIDQHLASWLVGHDVDRIEDIWQMVFRHTYWRGGPVLMTALAGIDMALWDIKGKRCGLPVYSLLGGKSRETVQAYMHVHGRDVKELIDRSLERVATGCKILRYSFDTLDPSDQQTLFCQPHQDTSTGKRIEVEGDSRWDVGIWNSDAYMEDLVRITSSLRKAVGPEIGLIHDVHGRLTPIQAARVARELEPYHLTFLEDPVEPLQKSALELVRNYSTTPIGIGELYNTSGDYRLPVQNQWLDYLRVDISHFGGITAIKKAADFADHYGIKVAFHGPTDISPIAYAATFHVDYVLPNFGVQEYAYHGDKTFEVFHVGFSYKQGYLYIDDQPGLGVRIDEQAALKYPYKPNYLPGLRDKSGAVHNW